MNWLKKLTLATVTGLLACAALAQTTVSGVKFEDTADVRGAKLQLNGAGTRYKAIFKVYAAGLYMTKKAGTTEEALATPGAKRIAITMLRDIDSNELGKLFTRSVQDNAPKAEMSRLVPGLIRMGQIFSDCKKLVSGESFLIDWVPGTGTVITISSPKCPQNNEAFKEPEFYNALMRIWLGPNPADNQLKEALLGKAS